MANYVSYRDGGKTNEEGLGKYLSRTLTAGIPTSFSTTSFAVSQRGAGANLSVDIAVGDGHFVNPAGSYSFWAWADAVNNVTISAADPSNPRIDAIVAYIDLSVVSSVSNNNPGALKFISVTGTASATPAAPTTTAMQTAVGALNPYLLLANVNVAAAAATIITANVSDRRTSIRSVVATADLSGYTLLSAAPSSVTANGSRSYSLVFNSVDYSSTISPGTRIRTTRTVAAPTQCTSLNGTTQYWSKTTPAGMTFTNNFVVSAWVKLSSYPASAGAIASRFNGTSGWALSIKANGTVDFFGFNAGGGNYSGINSYQSIPLNKWVHVTAQLDMATFTATATTSYVMIDGVDVPAFVSRSGTNPTALVQAGDLQIGASNGGSFFPGKLAQVAIFNAKVTQATMLSYISQGLAGTETSLASAFSFNGVATDLSTTTPNDLSASGSAVATNADSPFGGQAGGTISSTLDYGIVQSVSFSTNTTMVVQVAEGCTIPTSGGVASVAYSSNKAPFGFPAQRSKWRLETLILALVTASAGAASTAYNPGGLNTLLPIGEWHVEANITKQTFPNGTAKDSYFGLSTSASSFTDADLEQRRYQAGIVANNTAVDNFVIAKTISITTRTPYYWLVLSGVALSAAEILRGLVGTNTYEYSKVTAENAYL